MAKNPLRNEGYGNTEGPLNTNNRMLNCFAFVLAVTTCMIWYINIVSIRYLDSAYSSTTGTSSTTSSTSSISSWPQHPYLQTNRKGVKSIHKPILIPSHNKKFHLKGTLAQDLESTLTIYPNNTYSIQKDISSYLSFAIIGMSKTGTTSLLNMLSNSTSIIQKERCDLVIDDVPLLLNSLYNIRVRSSRKNKVTGIKCPQDLSSMQSIQNYKQYFHQTKLIVGLRHPILWFESLYNFNVRNMNKMAPTKKLERCIRGSHGVCAWRANVADFLRQLNKTPMEEDELEYMNLKESKVVNDKRRVGPVFLYEVNQLKYCESGNCSFAKDLADFIGIGHDLPHVPHITTAGVLDFVSGVKEFSQRTTRKRAKTWMPINSDPKRSMSLHLPHLCPHCSQGFESRQNHFGEDKK
mmetsp:Transcript_419/g.610  ORF Transcript_419/g.610 Transcript_419/m.610 type:complete len:408 (-) Transcript_419:755-1978(-)